MVRGQDDVQQRRGSPDVSSAQGGTSYIEGGHFGLESQFVNSKSFIGFVQSLVTQVEIDYSRETGVRPLIRSVNGISPTAIIVDVSVKLLKTVSYFRDLILSDGHP
jgi:hypothetical protein